MEKTPREEDLGATAEMMRDIRSSTGTAMASGNAGIILALFRWFMPPDKYASAEQQHSWRWAVCIALWLLIPASGAGVFTWYKYFVVDGVAHQSDVASISTQLRAENSAVAVELSALKTIVIGVRSDVHDDRVRGVSDQLFQLRVQISRDKTDDDKERDCKQFTNLTQLYLTLAGTYYRFEPQACDRL